MADYDFSDLSESSYADARADTPTLGDERGSNSEVCFIQIATFVGKIFVMGSSLPV